MGEELVRLLAELRRQLIHDRAVAKGVKVLGGEEWERIVQEASSWRTVQELMRTYNPDRALQEVEAREKMIDFAIQFGYLQDGEYGDCCSKARIEAGQCTDRGTEEALRVLRTLPAVTSSCLTFYAPLAR